MPGGNICEENLEQRIERIRKRDEEIEKRHREAEEDRLAALQANAMVKTTAPSDEDWPKAHKYDKLDFTYDVKPEDIADADDKKAADEPRLQRPFKKFPEGQGPPADPTYNFLADAERDGKAQAIAASNDSKNWRASNNNSNNNGSNINRRNNGNNSSFNRGRNGAKGKTPLPKGKSSDEPILRKNDRERNSDARNMQRQTSSDGMWRRTDDKRNDGKDNRNNVPTSPTGQSNLNTKTSNKPSIQQRMTPAKTDANNLQQKLSDLSIEKRGNITVAVTKDGEVKSVKLEAARVIGTGRVGGVSMRQVQPQQLQLQQQQQQQQIQQPQMQQQQPQLQSQLQQQYISSPPAPMMDMNLNAQAHAPVLIGNYPVIDHFKPPQQQAPPQPKVQSPPQQVIQSQVIQVDPTPKPAQIINGVPFKLPSVQDRLIKNRLFFDENLKNVAGNQ